MAGEENRAVRIEWRPADVWEGRRRFNYKISYETPMTSTELAEALRYVADLEESEPDVPLGPPPE